MENNQKLFSLEGYTDQELFARVDHSSLESEKITAPRYSYWKSVFRVFFKQKFNIFILCVLAVVLFFTYVYPSLVPYNAYANLNDASAKHLSPTAAWSKFGYSLSWCLGSGGSGQPTFDAIWYGAKISLSLGLIATAINLTIGVLLGAVWGFSKKMDKFMIEVVNIVGNVPSTLLISVLVLILRPGFWTLILAMTITEWLFVAYFFRTQVVIIRDREYNLASRCLGTPISRIATRNILPFLTSVIMTQLAVIIPGYINYEVFLSYIGLGVPDASLGRLINTSQSAMLTPGWEIEFWSPVMVCAILTICLYVLGQNLADASDPRTHM